MKKYVHIFLLTIAFSGFSQNNSRKIAEFNLTNKIALIGYDAVSYFLEDKPLKGKKEIAITSEGVVYNFASEKNKTLFLKNPDKYKPQYGGWCAYAMGLDGSKVEVDPKTFKIFDGKLYLFYNKLFNNTLKTWNKDEKKLMKNANNFWTQGLKK
jgi:YHS domain-containing protein